MIPRPAHRRLFPSARGGFTLVEVLLVLVVLATLAAVVAPAALRVFEDYALKQSAEAVRDDLTRARLDAVQEGVIYEFRAETGGTRWVVVPGEREPAANPGLGPADPLSWVPVRAGTLAEGVTFTTARTSGPVGGRLEPEYFAGLPDAAGLAGAQWSLPLRFLPDGTAAAAAEVSVTDEEGRVLAVSVRPLTGAATVGQIGADPRPGGTRR